MMEDHKNKPRYSVEHPGWPGCVAVAEYELPWRSEEYGWIAQLRCVTFNERSAWGFVNPVLKRLPGVVHYMEAGIPPEMKALQDERCVVKNMTDTDLSFARFWNQYGYKVGNKGTVEKKWNALTAEDRMLALQGIGRQRRHSESHRTDMPYPQTYIDQRRWENEFSN